MVTQPEVLAFIAERTAEGRAVGIGQVGDQFLVSLEGAAGHLWRLWRERLIEPLSPRPTRFRFRLEPGESIAPLRFRITPRGRQRLRWYDQAADDDGGLLFFR
jgi:hypothetical protein